MGERKPEWDLLKEEEKQEALHQIIAYFEEEWGEKIGLIAAEQVMDKVLEQTFNHIYNKGVIDAQKALEEHIADTNVALDMLLKK